MNIPILTFNSGEMTPKADCRSDVEKYRSGCRHLENFLPLIYGCVERRPGLYYITPAYGATQIVRMISFTAPLDKDYILEFGNKYIRTFYADTVITTISSPYLQEDLFQLQYTQVGDVMWIVHPDYPQAKLSRTSATTFSLDEIPFLNGPFLLRNDLIDPSVTDAATMACSKMLVGESGTLTCTGEVFDDLHVGALFKLIHPRTNTAVSLSAAGTSDALDVKGTFSFNTHGTWTGTVILQRRENSTSADDWEDYRTYPGKADRNVQLSSTEDVDNVEYRIYAEGVTGTFGADITVNESTQEGIVQITAVGTSVSATVTVITELASTNATKRWAEGAWSDYRGYPTSVTFFGDRCIYAGGSDVMNADEQIITLGDPLIVHTAVELIGGQGYLSVWGLTDVGDGTFVDYQTNGLDIDMGTSGGGDAVSDGTYIYYSDDNYLYKIDRNFDAVTSWGTNGRIAFSGIASKKACHHPTGNVVIAATTSSVKLLNSDGTVLWTATLLLAVRCLKFTVDGNVLVGVNTNYGNTAAFMLNHVDGSVLASFNTNVSSGDVIFDIVENPINNKIVITCKYKGTWQIVCYKASGGGVGNQDWTTTLTPTPSANGTSFVYCSSYGNIYTSFQNSSYVPSIYKYNSDGNLIDSYRTGTTNDLCYCMTQRDLSTVVVGCAVNNIDSANEDGAVMHIQVFDNDLNYQRGYYYGGYGSTTKSVRSAAIMLDI